ncbi:MAG: hypothetical protein EAX81_02115 [Candidatus Thorarchaeota archaeon]|nr:hypothetical protein [Candidatus Thorarchaeota archaeon]
MLCHSNRRFIKPIGIDTIMIESYPTQEIASILSLPSSLSCLMLHDINARPAPHIIPTKNEMM